MGAFDEEEGNKKEEMFSGLDNYLESLLLLIGSNARGTGEKGEYVDSRTGRTKIGATYEDSHLYWPIRPKVWSSYPEANSTIHSGSRDDLFLQAEQRCYADVQNNAWIAQRLAPHQGHQTLTPSAVDLPLPSTSDSEFWENDVSSSVKSRFFDLKAVDRSTIAATGAGVVGGYVLLGAKSPGRLVATGLFGFASMITARLYFEGKYGVAGFDRQMFDMRVRNAVYDRALRNAE